MSARQPARRQRGLTLIELMVALAIFAVLGVLSYRALAEVSTSRTRLEDGFERWRSIGRAMQRIDADLLQLVAPAASASTTAVAPMAPAKANPVTRYICASNKTMDAAAPKAAPWLMPIVDGEARGFFSRV